MRIGSDRGWRKLHSEKVCELYTSRNLWVNGGIMCVEEKRNLLRASLGNLKERDCFEDPKVDGSILLKWILKKCEQIM